MYALYVDLGRWLGKGKVRRAESDLQVLFEKPLQEVDNGSFQIGKANVLVHHQAFNLMEHRAMGQVRISAINPTGTNYPNGWRLMLHGMYLTGRCMGTQ